MSITPEKDNFVIVIHGGAEDKSRQDLGPKKERGYRQGLPVAEAARRARETYPDKIQKDRNLIALSPQGEVALEYETQLMFRGYRKNHDPPFVAIWDETGP